MEESIWLKQVDVIIFFSLSEQDSSQNCERSHERSEANRHGKLSPFSKLVSVINPTEDCCFIQTMDIVFPPLKIFCSPVFEENVVVLS